MATTATFSPATGLLTVIGDSLPNAITVSRNTAGNLLVNGGAVPVKGGTATVANTGRIQVFGQNGDDTISLNETNGALPAADLFGGDGNDVLTGGAGNDQVFGQAGNDRMIWNPGDGSDLFEGGDGIDTAEVNGGNGVENFTITANGTRVRFDRISPAPFSIDIGTTENLVLNANGGDDVITAGNGLASLIQLTIDGGAGNDTITGGDGNDVLIGGDGNDVITGGRGSDTAILGNGDDMFVWNPGDGSDTVEGQSGFDTLRFNGANVNETIDISANGSRVRLFRNVGNVTMDLNSVERIQLGVLGGADNITVNDLTGTGLKQVALDLSAPAGTGTGDGQPDTVILNATAANNHITIVGSGTSIGVNGLPVSVTIDGVESANDSLVINALGGNDVIDASALGASLASLTIDGGVGNDTITGSGGADVLIGGDGNDVVTGGRGNDIAFLGNGDDTFIWNPGDGSDIVEGQSGLDTLVFNGSNASENIDISATGSRARLFRDVGNVTMDINGLERIRLAAFGGNDTITVNDLTGTDVTQVAIDLAATPGTNHGDGQPDTVIVNGTAGNDHIVAVSSGASVIVNGLVSQVTINGGDPGGDSLVINGLGGDDTIDASALKAGQINLTINGGDGNDIITGSNGNDVIDGGRGTDVAFMGKGDDEFVWNPGDGSDTVEGQAGFDTLLFNGANVNENISISANGSRAILARNVAAINMDLNGIERIQLNTLGGADNITVNDLTGTSVQQVAVDLDSPPGSGNGDGQPDTIIINGTNGDDVITVTANNGTVTVAGLPTAVTITGFDATDRIVINGLGGDDVIQASGLGTAMLFSADGGDGADVLIGSAGNDTLSGGAGDDVLIGGPGIDTLDGGPGDNIQIQAVIAGPLTADTGNIAIGSDSANAPALAAQGAYNGTANNDVITITGSGASAIVHGLAVPATIALASGVNGPIAIHGLAGNDIIDVSGLQAPAMRFILDGGDGNDVLHGGQGNDVLVGGAGSDRFEFSGFNGTDTIADFQHGLDTIRIAGYGAALHSFSDLAGHIAQVGADVQVNLDAKIAGAGTIVLQNTQLTAVSASDFAFA